MSSTSFKLKKGLDLPLAGEPDFTKVSDVKPQTVAVLGRDYVGLKPRLAVEEGDVVGAGAPIMYHKDTPEVLITSPVSGRIKAINRGYRRALISVEVEVDDSAAEPVNFSKVGDDDTSDGIAAKLAASGLWTSFRTRPFSKVPALDARPAAIFINAMDTEPHAPDPALIIGERSEDFRRGVEAIAKLCDGPTYLSHAPDAEVPGGDVDGVTTATFSGPHPAGLSGTHIHFLSLATAERFVWTIGYQDVIAIGALMRTGTLDSSRLISLAGPLVNDPRLMRTVAGASLHALTDGEYNNDVPARVISGSILSGRSSDVAEGAYLGRYANQVSVIEEDHQQNLLGWIRPMPHKFATMPVLGSALSRKKFPLNSNLNGGRRAMVPTGVFEELMPQDYLPTQLLRALLVMDTDAAQDLGVLELDEEDLSLVTFACPAKYEYGLALRDCLTKIEKEG